MKKHDIINSFNPDVPDENFFIFPNLLIVEKKPFPEVDHLRKRLLFLYIDRKPPLPDRIAGKGGFFISENGIW